MLTFGAPQPIADIKALGDGEYRVSGYASTFNNVDLGKDVVMPGAFDRTLKDGHKIRFLAHHRPDQVLGVPEVLKTDKKGLFGQWKIVPTQLGEETYQLLKAGALDSFSIGYVVKDQEWADSGEVRQLKDIELLECSVVSIPMNPEAVVTAVKQWADGFEQRGDMEEERNYESLSFTDLVNEAGRALDALGKSAQQLLVTLTDVDAALTESKRQELERFLGTFPGLDAVRTDVQRLLQTKPESKGAPSLTLRHQLHSRLEDARRQGVLN